MQERKLTIVNFSTRFSELVENCGLSQKELAAKLGISEGSIVNYKRDRIPKAEELLAICSYFEKTMEWLLTGIGASSIEETINGAEAFTAMHGGQAMTQSQREGARRVLQKRDVAVTLAAMEKRAEEAEKEVARLSSRLAAVRCALEKEDEP